MLELEPVPRRRRARRFEEDDAPADVDDRRSGHGAQKRAQVGVLRREHVTVRVVARCHLGEAFALGPRFEVAAFPSFEALRKVDDGLAGRSELVQCSDTALRDHYYFHCQHWIEKLSYTHTWLDVALEDVLDARFKVELLVNECFHKL